MSEAEVRIEWPDGLRLERPLLTDILQVCLLLDSDQRDQWEAIEGEEYDPEEVALRMATCPGPKWVMTDADGTPFALGGFQYIGPGVWQDFLLTTPVAWEQRPLLSTRACKHMLEVMLADPEVHRLQAMVLASREKVRNWYRLVGYEYEGTLRGYAASGDDVAIYGRVKHG